MFKSIDRGYGYGWTWNLPLPSNHFGNKLKWNFGNKHLIIVASEWLSSRKLSQWIVNIKRQVHDIWRRALINYDQFSKEHFTELFMVSHTICIQVKCKRSDHCYMRIPLPKYIVRKMLVTFNFSQWIHICFAVFLYSVFVMTCWKRY